MRGGLEKLGATLQLPQLGMAPWGIPNMQAAARYRNRIAHRVRLPERMRYRHRKGSKPGLNPGRLHLSVPTKTPGYGTGNMQSRFSKGRWQEKNQPQPRSA
jgi:hypothetical protein